ncbi:DUF296 domain-containing protein [Synechococcus sp. A10-1-5-1]|uniref:PCC domain-containing protein n=1 Tax=Synechococcus sp. A10-1-5-1 TaxID=2936507 RepID=UPI002000EDEA|nr:DUF296 domain-containing protein [Synechococcus sp. A10-1-5-1]UPM50591.1 DUF296 domain-containing protein [Synechococcus sp. A10-1-5-1]
MEPKAIHLGPGADLRKSLEALAQEELAEGFVLSVVGNLSKAAFACPGSNQPTVLSGELEIITLQGTVSPKGVHLHLSFSDGDCQVWGGHLEHGSEVLRGADVLVGLLKRSNKPGSPTVPGQPRIKLAVAEGCPWSSRAMRMLRSLGIPFEQAAPEAGSLPQIWIEGTMIGGYEDLADWHGQGKLERFRTGS